jgi:hypothetical protein
VEEMLRYQGFPELMRKLVEMELYGGENGLLKEEGMVLREVVRVLVGAKVAKERYVPPVIYWMCEVIDCVWVARSSRTPK